MEKKRLSVSVITEDKFLFQKIRLELSQAAECKLCSDEKAAEDCDIMLWDTDFSPCTKKSATTMSRVSEADVMLPFSLGTLIKRISNGGKKLQIYSEDKSCRLGERLIRLTDVEFSLLFALMKRAGGFATREELLREVWGEDADGGVINVYIHYLREKLESDGERVILSSRGAGYRINDLYLEARSYD